MNPTHKATLIANRHHYDTLIQAGYVAHLDYATKIALRDAIAAEFIPGYNTNLNCSPCVAEMVKVAYEHFDKVEFIKHETFPKHGE